MSCMGGATHEECVKNIKTLSVSTHIDLFSAYNSAQQPF